MNIISNYQMKSLNLNQTTNNQKIQTNPNFRMAPKLIKPATKNVPNTPGFVASVFTAGTLITKFAMDFFAKLKIPKGAKKLEDGSFYAQEKVTFSKGRQVATPIIEHVNSVDDVVQRSPWGISSNSFLREIQYDPKTKTTRISESDGGRFLTLKDISSDGKCIYTVLEPKSGGKIVYNGYNSKFKQLPNVEQTITCLDKEGKILAEFNSTQIKQGSCCFLDYSQDICAQSFLNVRKLEDGPRKADYSVGDFHDLVNLMKFVVRKGANK